MGMTDTNEKLLTLSPAMWKAMHVLHRDGSLDDGDASTNTLAALVGRGLIREWDPNARCHWPATTPDEVWDEAHAQDRRTSDYTMVPRGQVRPGDLIPCLVHLGQHHLVLDDAQLGDAIWKRVTDVETNILVDGDYVYLFDVDAIPVRTPANTPAEQRTGISDTTHAILQELAKARSAAGPLYNETNLGKRAEGLLAEVTEALDMIQKLAGGEGS